MAKTSIIVSLSQLLQSIAHAMLYGLREYDNMHITSRNKIKLPSLRKDLL